MITGGSRETADNIHMQEDILISIIVPVYNIEKYLNRCVDSLTAQTYRNIEIILVDDGSTDGCAGICEKYALSDRRIKVIHKANGGLVSARKTGAREAKGEYLVNVDGDDWIEPDRIQHLVDKGISGHADMVYMSGLRKEYKDKSILFRKDIPCKIYNKEEIIDELIPLFTDVSKCFHVSLRHNIWMWAVKRELLQKVQQSVDDRIVMAEDQICIWRCLLEAGSVTVIEEDGYHYLQQREDAITYLPSGRYKEGLKIWFEGMRSSIGRSEYYERIKQIWASAAVITILLSDYSVLMEESIDFLYPFKEVKKGSKIAVYGAGQIGRNIVQALDKTKDYEMLLWVDKNAGVSPLPGQKICPVTELVDGGYDFVILAVLDAQTTEKIKDDLVRMGIPKEKIARMEPEVISEEVLLRAFIDEK